MAHLRIGLCRNGASVCLSIVGIRIAKLNMPRLGRIKVCPVLNALWRSAPIAEKPSVKDAGWNAAGILTAVSATTTTKHIPAFGNPFRVSTGLAELPCIRQADDKSPGCL